MWMSLILSPRSRLPPHSAEPHLPSPLGPRWLWRTHLNAREEQRHYFFSSSPPVWGCACSQPYMPRSPPQLSPDWRPATVAGRGTPEARGGDRRPADGASREGGTLSGWELKGRNTFGWEYEGEFRWHGRPGRLTQMGEAYGWEYGTGEERC